MTSPRPRRRNWGPLGTAPLGERTPGGGTPTLAETRRGLNTILAYERAGVRHEYRVRTKDVTYGVNMLGDESHARTTRSFYPHRVSPQRFSIVVVLNGYEEYRSFSRWMMSYANYALDPNLSGAHPDMECTIETIGFTRRGVPLTGTSWGDKVGKAVWEIPVEFESTREPWSSRVVDTSLVGNYDDLYSKEKAAMYWYPEGVHLAGDEKPLHYEEAIHKVRDGASSVLDPLVDGLSSVLGVISGLIRDDDKVPKGKAGPLPPEF